MKKKKVNIPSKFFCFQLELFSFLFSFFYATASVTKKRFYNMRSQANVVKLFFSPLALQYKTLKFGSLCDFVALISGRGAWGCSNNTSFSSLLFNGPNKLCLYSASLYHSSLFGEFVSYEENGTL
jgi:hypothetical protein